MPNLISKLTACCFKPANSPIKAGKSEAEKVNGYNSVLRDSFNLQPKTPAPSATSRTGNSTPRAKTYDAMVDSYTAADFKNHTG